MNPLRILTKRVLMGLVTSWVVLTTIFALFTLTEDWVLSGQIGAARFAGENDPEALAAIRAEYFAARGLDRPLTDVYVDWLGNMVTLNWGSSMSTGEPVFPLVMDAAARTAAYVVPALVLAVICGVSIGMSAALYPKSRVGSGGVAAAYLLFAVPTFWLGGMILSFTLDGRLDRSPLVFDHLLPIGLTFTALLGGYVSYSRAHSREYATAEFVSLVKAKGASGYRVAYHVLRNAAIPFFSMLFTEALGLLVLSTFVIEVLFGIEGFGLLLLQAVADRDLPVLLGGTVVVIGVGVFGNVVQDMAYGYLDPRVEMG
ncbi:peptide/nickel transport system permease protein [Halorubrum trapanicum]|uniref:Peptide/nickel transport system permease protein n=1 Tax=Halorubrum trapanicum TaxID=29284 RepID=A0A8J7RVF0_9EURY|nr:ABC transporter permease [Halorubrum trapanicum]MBP1902332.1 peptide/nickel transport system permease protein [Halorubrum trapanicum]